MQVSIGIIDSLVLLAAIGLAIGIGLRASGKNNSLEAFLLGDRNLPWWAILGSIVATETSTATVLSLPAAAFGPTGLKFLQIAFGYLIGRSILVYLLLPLYFQGKLFSAYEVMGRRFGESTKTASSLLFLVTRNLGDGLRLFLAALVIRELLGWPFWLSAASIGAITMAYTYFGGIRSVVWNDCIQLVIYMIGGVVSLFIIAGAIDGGWPAFWEYAEAEDKLRVFQFSPPTSFEGSWWYWLVSDPFCFWTGLLGGAILTLGTHGTDQMMVQRYLSAKSQPDARRAILGSAVVVLVQFALFLFIGAQLACFYSQQPDVDIEKLDQVYARFIVQHFPQDTGLVGLMLAAILAAAMSTLSSSLNASASATMNDFVLPRLAKQPEPARALALTRYLCIAFGVLQIFIGLGANSLPPDSTVVSNALSIAGYSAGLLLGLFCLGVLTSFVGQTAALTGAAIGLVTLLYVQFGLPSQGVRVAWPWFAAIGSCTTFFSAIVVQNLMQLVSKRSQESKASRDH